MTDDELGQADEYAAELRDALEGMVQQFAYWSDAVGGYMTGGLSALEDAFAALDWPDPKPEPGARCDEPGCLRQRSSGTPTPDGYRWTCSDHAPWNVALHRVGEEGAPE